MTPFVYRIRATALLVVCAASANAGVVGETLRYSCDRGATVYATFVGSDADSNVVLALEGQQIALAQQVSASGAKFAPPEGQEGYGFWLKGDEALLYWQGKTEEDSPKLANCKAVK